MNVSDLIIEGLYDDMVEGERLKTLTNKELVLEYVMSESDIVIDEMLTRLDSEWGKETEH